MKLLSLFSGIGAFEKALDNLGVSYELAAFCEFDEHAVKSYCAIHGVDESKNLGDITKVDESKLPADIDLLTYGFPCQDISISGKQKGMLNADGTRTRSGLFFEALRIIEATNPKIAIAENVKNLVSNRFKQEFKVILTSLENAGYNNYWAVLNSKNYCVPQNRERVFIVSIRKDIDTGDFEFPKPVPLQKRLADIKEDSVDEKYYLSDVQLQSITFCDDFYSVLRDGAEKATVAVAMRGRYNDHGHTEQRIEVSGREYANTITTVQKDSLVGELTIAKCIGGIGERKSNGGTQWYQQDRVYKGDIALAHPANLSGGSYLYMLGEHAELTIRRLTPKECFRLMGFDDESFHRAEAVNKETQLYKQSGNSIVVPVLEYIIKALLDSVLKIKKQGERNMELEIYSPGADGFVKEITWNHEEIKREVAEKVSRYQNIVYTDDQISEAKTDRANLRKFVDALEAKRKEIKKRCLEPYEVFEKQVKEITRIVNQPIMLIDGQVKEYEEGKREEKRAAIEAYWITLSEDGKIPEGIRLDQIFNEKWLNASVNIRVVCAEINSKLEQIKKDLATLAEMPEFAFEATEIYKDTLDLNKAIAEGRRLLEMQKRKAEAERLRAEAEAATQTPSATSTPDDHAADVAKYTAETINAAQSKQWLSFAALLSMEDALALKDFFNSRNIEFKKN